MHALCLQSAHEAALRLFSTTQELAPRLDLEIEKIV